MFQFQITNVQRETLLMRYKDEQAKTRLAVSNLYKTALKAVAQYEAFELWLQATGDDELIAYNAANAGLMAGAEEQLLGYVVGTIELIEAMQNAMPDGFDLFPGVPRVVENIEP